MKTFKAWEKSGMDLEDYLGDIPVRIDEEIYCYILDQAEYVDENFVQSDDISFTKGEYPNRVPYHVTVMQREGGKYYYLGILPEFKQ